MRLDFLSRFVPGRDQVDEQGHFFYGQYYAVQAMFLAGGKYWAEWYPAIRELLLSRENKATGTGRGSRSGLLHGNGADYFTDAESVSAGV